MRYKYTLPYPPLTNNLYSTQIRGGKNTKARIVRVKSERATNFREEAQSLMLTRLRPSVLLTGPVAVRLKSYRPRRSGDIDGIVKAVLDAMKGMIYVDDEQVIILRVRRGDDKHNPRVEVTVRALCEQGALL